MKSLVPLVRLATLQFSYHLFHRALPCAFPLIFLFPFILLVTVLSTTRKVVHFSVSGLRVSLTTIREFVVGFCFLPFRVLNPRNLTGYNVKKYQATLTKQDLGIYQGFFQDSQRAPLPFYELPLQGDPKEVNRCVLVRHTFLSKRQLTGLNSKRNKGVLRNKSISCYRPWK